MTSHLQENGRTGGEAPPPALPEYTLPKNASLAVAGLALVEAACFTAWILLYATWGDSFIEGLERSIGDVVMEEGIRFQNAQDYENAALSYLEALQNPFTHAKNRTGTLRRLGTLSSWLEVPAWGIPYLVEASEKSEYPISLFEPLCQVLLAADRTDNALAHAQRWFDRALESGARRQQTRAKLIEGHIHRKRGDTERAFKAYVEGNAIQSGGLVAYYAGLLSYEAGDQENALRYLELCLQDSTGEAALKARTLRGRILEETGSR